MGRRGLTCPLLRHALLLQPLLRDGGMDELKRNAVVNIQLDMVRKTQGTSMDGDVPLTGKGPSLGGSATVDGRGGVSVSLIE